VNHQIGNFVLRRPEPTDLEILYGIRNDPQIAPLLGGFSNGYSRADMKDWLEFHRQRSDEVLWVIAKQVDDVCVGHVGFYQIDHRIRTAEFAIVIGDRSVWSKGLGRACTRFAIDYGLNELNLNRIHLSVLATNERAIHLYHSLGFRDEGRLRAAQYKGGQYIDIVLMSILRTDCLTNAST